MRYYSQQDVTGLSLPFDSNPIEDIKLLEVFTLETFSSLGEASDGVKNVYLSGNQMTAISGIEKKFDQILIRDDIFAFECRAEL